MRAEPIRLTDHGLIDMPTARQLSFDHRSIRLLNLFRPGANRPSLSSVIRTNPAF